MARTDTLPHFLADVADAIREKTGESGTIQASSFDTAISNIPSGGGKYAPKFISFRASGLSDLTYETTNLDTVNLTSLANMFENNYELTSFNGSGWDTSNITTTNAMFYQCYAIASFDFTNWNTTKVSNMGNMFYGCTSITSLDLSSFSTPLLTNTREMFSMCKNLSHIDMRNMILTGITSNNYSMSMFGGSSSNGVPDDCEIIVKDASQKAWINNKFARLTNVKTVAEYEAEQNQ